MKYNQTLSGDGLYLCMRTVCFMTVIAYVFVGEPGFRKTQGFKKAKPVGFWEGFIGFLNEQYQMECCFLLCSTKLE